MLEELSDQNQFNWQVELVYNPDKILAESQNIVVSSDGWILDRCESWCNLGAFLIQTYFKENASVLVF